MIALVSVMPWIRLFCWLQKIKPRRKISRWSSIVWIGSILVIAVGEVTAVSLLMMMATGVFILVILDLTTLVSTRAITGRYLLEPD